MTDNRSEIDEDEVAQNDTDEILQDDVVLQDAKVAQNAIKEIEPVAGPSKSPPIVEDMNAYSLNDDSDDDVYVPIRNASSSITENLNEYTFDSDLESENDANESLALLAKKYLGKSKTNPALTYMLEYSGLSQKQIIDLIKRNKNESNTASKSAKEPEKNDRFDNLKENNNSTDEKSGLNCGETPKSVQSAQEAHVADNDTNVELIPSSPESNNFVESEPTKDRESCVTVTSTGGVSSDSGIILEKQSPVTKSNDVTQMDTSDSDCDDFIEIQDVPLPIVNMSRNIARKDIEITFKTDEKIEDDMFADVFEKVDKNAIEPVNRVEQTQSSVSGNDDHHQVQVISENSDNVRSNVLYTILEESIEEETKTETRENTQSTEDASTDGNKHDSQSSNETMEQNDINFLPQVSPVNECTRQKSPVLPTNEEDLIELKVLFNIIFIVTYWQIVVYFNTCILTYVCMFSGTIGR